MILHTFVILAYKESRFLEDCIKSIIAQEYDGKVIIATTTENSFIKKLAKKYSIPLVIGKHTSIGGDFDFALSCANTPLITIAHQDDIYEKNYAAKMVEAYCANDNASIIFSDYFEIRNKKKIFNNTNLTVKRALLVPLRLFKKARWARRFSLKFGNSICCPAVTFVKTNCPTKVFESNFVCNVDWHAWEKLSKMNHSFIFVPEQLMGHRISTESTTTDTIKQGIRTKEDYAIFRRFWPECVAKFLTRLYKNSEKSNELN